MLPLLIGWLLIGACTLSGAGPVYVTLWFDTEDYIEPASDDAVLRIARDLTAEGVRATFKVVGEKARVLEKRGRRDVIAAMQKHAIGYHSNWHSVHPTPAEYLVRMGYLEGAAEFERREAPGVADVKRVFGRQPVCYGQPGSSWGPQSNTALRRMGIPMYLDEGSQVGVDEQPFWYGGLLYVFQMKRNQFRAQLNVGAEDPAAYKKFDEAAARLAAQGGGTISIYYHPNEFVTTEFWDGVNFQRGANPEREAWVAPKRRTSEDSERCYGVLRKFVQHMKAQRGVRFVTADELLGLYREASPKAADRRVDQKEVAAQLSRGIGFGEVGGRMMSAAEMLLALAGVPAAGVDGPATRGSTTYSRGTIEGAAWRRAVGDFGEYVRKFQRLPAEVFVGAETLSLEDFAATLAGGGERVVKGKVEFERYFSTEGKKSFNWVIHPEGFDGGPLLEMGRLQGWTLKPARLAK